MIYRPSEYSNIDLFDEYIQTILQRLSKTKNPSFIMSDLNIDMLNMTDTTTTFLNTMSTFCIKPNIIRPTRLNNHIKFTSLIDNIFTNTTNDSFSGTIVYDISDHLPILFSAYTKKTDYEPRHTTYTRNFTKRSVDDFIRKISQENWMTVYLQNNPENAYNNFLKIFYFYYNSCFSVTAKTTKSNRPRKDWCTLDIVKSCKTKCRLHETFIRKPTSVNKQNYITFRNKLSQTIRNAKQTYYSNLFTKSNNKKTWSCINSILTDDKTKHIPSQILMNYKLITNSKNLCDCLNSYFANLGTNLSKGIPSSASPLNYVIFLHHSLFFTPTNQLEIEKINSNLKITSLGYDEMHPKIIKQISMIIAIPLSHIMNCSLISGIVPSKLKIAKVIPIFKRRSSRRHV